MRVGPGAPCEGHCVTSVDRHKVGANSSTLVAGNVQASVAGGFDETNILVQRIPASRLGLVLALVEPHGVGAGGELAVDGGASDKAVGIDNLGCHGSEYQKLGEHCEVGRDKRVLEENGDDYLGWSEEI